MHREEDVSAQHATPQKATRLSPADAHTRGPTHPCQATGEGPDTAVGLSEPAGPRDDVPRARWAIRPADPHRDANRAASGRGADGTVRLAGVRASRGRLRSRPAGGRGGRAEQ